MTSDNHLTKKSFKLIEIPVNNFKNEAIPYHLKLLDDHKNVIQKEAIDYIKMRNEVISIKRIICQLHDLLRELDTLRTQVKQVDLDKFDSETVSLRKSFLQIKSEYTELLKKVTAAVQSPEKNSSQLENEELVKPPQLQLSKSIDELKLEQSAVCLETVEQIQTDIQDLHCAYGTLHQMVNEQKENVDIVEQNVEEAQHNVNVGAQHIITASRLKASVYPVTGALIGTCIGGPLGLIAGLKVGGIAAVSCGLFGFVGGKVLKKRALHQSDENQIVPDVSEENLTINSNKIKKKE